MSSGGLAGDKALVHGSNAHLEYAAHPNKNEIGAHLEAAQKAIKAGSAVEAKHHLTSALVASYGKNAGALRATISSRRSKLGGLNEPAAGESLPGNTPGPKGIKPKSSSMLHAQAGTQINTPEAKEMVKLLGVQPNQVTDKTIDKLRALMKELKEKNADQGKPKAQKLSEAANSLSIAAVKDKSLKQQAADAHEIAAAAYANQPGEATNAHYHTQMAEGLKAQIKTDNLQAKMDKITAVISHPSNLGLAPDDKPEEHVVTMVELADLHAAAKNKAVTSKFAAEHLEAAQHAASTSEAAKHLKAAIAAPDDIPEAAEPVPVLDEHAGEQTLLPGTAAYEQFMAHPNKAQIGTHLDAAWKSMKSGDVVAAHAHLTNALKSIGGDSSPALKATISSRRSKLGVKGADKDKADLLATVAPAASSAPAPELTHAQVDAQRAKLVELITKYSAAKAASKYGDFAAWTAASNDVKAFLKPISVDQLTELGKWASDNDHDVAAIAVSKALTAAKEAAVAKPKKAKSADDTPVTLAQAISAWKGSSFAISMGITDIINGKEPLSVHSAVMWEALKTKTKAAPDGKLYRGMKWNANDLNKPGAQKLWDAIDKGAGTEFDIGAASFSKKSDIAMTFSGAKSADSYARVLVLTTTNARGFDIQHAGGGFAHEAEMISGGRFKITKVVTQYNISYVTAEHIGAFG
jgi:hypothetical protein